MPNSRTPPGPSEPPVEKRRQRALTFSGGAFDSAMQLGVAHALLVSRGAAPDYVVGVSAGAVNAAALADILQAGKGKAGRAALDARVDAFRRFLNSWREIPRELVRAILPDLVEITDQGPLQPINLPIHHPQERADREQANRSKAGLTRLLNHLLRSRVKVGTATRFIRHCLSLEELPAQRSTLDKAWKGAKASVGLLILGWRSAYQVAPLFWDVLVAILFHAPAPPQATAADRIFESMTWRRVRRALLGALQLIGFFPAWPIFLIVTGILLLRPRTSKRFFPAFVARYLRHFELGRGLASSDVLKQQLVKCFDPAYYGRVDLPEVLESAFDEETASSVFSSGPRTLGDFEESDPKIVVGPVAARVETGDLEIFGKEVPVVDALLAACATAPLFPAVAPQRAKGVFIDGVNVSNEAISPLMEFLRRHPLPEGTDELDVYPVSPVPVSSPPTGDRGTTYPGIARVVARAIQLRRYRDATIEQRLTRLYTKALPPTGAAEVHLGGKTYIRAAVYPIEPDAPITVNQKILLSGDQDLNVLLHETVADGCRAALEGMIPEAIRAAAGKSPSVACRAAIRVRLQHGAQDGAADLPGSARELGPGVEEICRRCHLAAPRDAAAAKHAAPQAQSLRVREENATRPEWPLEGRAREAVPDRTSRPDEPRYTFEAGWPRPDARTDGAPNDDGRRKSPLINLLFGGGVFRGVFHMGVANALNELHVQPDLVAGSSVGSIIAAMIAQLLTLKDPIARHAQVARLAATFLAMDRLIPTDRLADFIRRFTLRAAATDFSLRDLDFIYRRYDADRADAHQERVRRVAAGIERLFYLTSFQQWSLRKAGGVGDLALLRTSLERALQEFLDRSGVGRELLGAEPLSLLIENHVIRPLENARNPNARLFKAFLDAGVYFLATATNLTVGELDILGSPYAPPNATLLYGLLASSAFPGVFRPREAWEVFLSASHGDQYIDGGTIDNLPLDAVARFLDRTEREGRITRRPRMAWPPLGPGTERPAEVEVPHLLFTASLERDVSALPPGDLRERCIDLWQRADTFTNNQKVDAYQRVQNDLRSIYTARLQTTKPEDIAWKPVDIAVVAVKPQWMCDTFGFHPMLGFRRRKQAQSIAHGCASTLAAMSKQAREQPAWAAGWGIAEHTASIDPKSVDGATLSPGERVRAGDCWFRDRQTCPFSKTALKELEKGGAATWLGPATVEEISQIHVLCGEKATHEPFTSA